MTLELEHVNQSQPENNEPGWQGLDHPFSGATSDSFVRTSAKGGSDPTGTATTDNLASTGGTPAAPTGQLDIPPLTLASVTERPGLDMPPIFSAPEAPAAPEAASAPEMPAPIQQAIASGTPIHFSSAGENQQANRQPDYFLEPDGSLVHNDKATPSADGSINIQLQSSDQAGNQSLRDAIQYESKMQQQAAEEMIRYFKEAHPNEQVPSWMSDLATKQPNLPDFVPFTPAPNAPRTAPPENGFVSRGVSSRGHGGGGGDGGVSGFAGNGGFDNQGYFKGNGSGDGSVYSGTRDSHGKPLGAGEQVQAKQIYDYLTDQYHLTPAQASGILGNMQTESSFRTNAYNSHEGAVGLCQWEGNRRTDLEHFAAQHGGKETDWKVQVDFMMHELKEGKEGTAWQALQHAETPAQAAAAFDHFYERSAGTSRGERTANAENIFQHVATNA